MHQSAYSEAVRALCVTVFVPTTRRGQRGAERVPGKACRREGNAGGRRTGAYFTLLSADGFPGGLSPWNTSRFFAMNDFHCGGTSSSRKIAVTGHSGSHAPQSMHSSGWM